MDKIKMSELKKAAAAISDKFGVDMGTASKIIGSLRKDPRQVAQIIGGDFSSIPAAAQNLGYTLTASADISQTTDIFPAEFAPDGLPSGLPELIYSFIDDFCRREKVDDLKKERQTFWKALCMECGAVIFKKSKYLHDIEREKRRGGTIYDFSKLSALCDLWAALCYKYNKTPTIDDFARFAAVSDTFLYGNGAGYDGQEMATPERLALLKKLHAMQEAGLSSLIVDGRQNPTGALAALNHWHGWTQTREIIHTAGPATQAAPALPVFSEAAGLLTDSAGDQAVDSQ